MLLRTRFLGTWKNVVVTNTKYVSNDKLRNNVVTTFMRNLNLTLIVMCTKSINNVVVT